MRNRTGPFKMFGNTPGETPQSNLYEMDAAELQREKEHMDRTIEGVISGAYFTARDGAKRMWREVQVRLRDKSYKR